MKKSLIYLSAITVSLMSINVANADTATGTLAVSATIEASCAVNTSSTGTVTSAALDFGTISSLTSNVDANTSDDGTSIKVLCTNGTSWALALGSGSNVSSSQRRMIGGSDGDYLPYDLYSDSDYSTSIGIDTTAYSGTGTGSVQTVDVYGRIPSGTTLPSADSYTDSVTLTVTF